MKKCIAFETVTIIVLVFAAAGACGDDDSQADKVGIGAECTINDACAQTDQTCLTEFKGGYCGKANCTLNKDCPESSACVAYENGTNYCFRICTDKAQCNSNRSLENEANCSSNITFVESTTSIKTCVPPSSGTETTAADAGVSNKKNK